MNDETPVWCVVSGGVLRPAEDYDDPDSDWGFEATYTTQGHALVVSASQALYLEFGTQDWETARDYFIKQVQQKP